MEDETYWKVRKLMRKKRVTNRHIAEAAAVKPNHVTAVLVGRRKGYRIREVIAQLLGVDVIKLWPDHPVTRRAA